MDDVKPNVPGGGYIERVRPFQGVFDFIVTNAGKRPLDANILRIQVGLLPPRSDATEAGVTHFLMPPLLGIIHIQVRLLAPRSDATEADVTHFLILLLLGTLL